MTLICEMSLLILFRAICCLGDKCNVCKISVLGLIPADCHRCNYDFFYAIQSDIAAKHYICMCMRTFNC